MNDFYREESVLWRIKKCIFGWSATSLSAEHSWHVSGVKLKASPWHRHSVRRFSHNHKVHTSLDFNGLSTAQGHPRTTQNADEGKPWMSCPQVTAGCKRRTSLSGPFIWRKNFGNRARCRFLSRTDIVNNLYSTSDWYLLGFSFCHTCTEQTSRLREIIHKWQLVVSFFEIATQQAAFTRSSTSVLSKQAIVRDGKGDRRRSEKQVVVTGDWLQAVQQTDNVTLRWKA